MTEFKLDLIGSLYSEWRENKYARVQLILPRTESL